MHCCAYFQKVMCSFPYVIFVSMCDKQIDVNDSTEAFIDGVNERRTGVPGRKI